MTSSMSCSRVPRSGLSRSLNFGRFSLYSHRQLSISGRACSRLANPGGVARTHHLVVQKIVVDKNRYAETCEIHQQRLGESRPAVEAGLEVPAPPNRVVMIYVALENVFLRRELVKKMKKPFLKRV